MASSIKLAPIPIFIRVLLRFGQVVGLCVLLAAVWVLTTVVAYVVDGVRMRSWTPAEATIETAQYRHVEGNAGPQVFATYRYRFDGLEHQGTRVDVAEGAELVGGFQERMANELQAHIADGTPAAVYVNPERPDESVLFPKFHWTVFAVRLGLFVVMALFGVAFFWGLGASMRRYKRLARRSKEHPNEPWLWYPEWAERRIPSTSHHTDAVFVGLGLFYLLVVLPVGLLVLVEWEREVTDAPGIVLMVVGLMMFNMTCYGWKRRRRFGRSEFQMSMPTGVIGGALAGVVTIPYKFRADKRCRVSLECVRKVSRGEGAGREVVEWRTTSLLDQTLDPTHPEITTVPIYQAIDFDCQPWDWAEGRSWRLKVGPDEEGFPHFAQFAVPVFVTVDSSPDFEPDPTILAPYAARTDAERALGRMCRIEPLPDGGERLRFSYFNPFAVTVIAGLLAALAAAIAAIIYFDFHLAWTLLPGIFGFVVLLGLCEMLIWGSRLEIRPDEVTVVAGLAPFRKRWVFLRAAVGERVHVEAHKELQMETRDWYGVRLRIETPDEPVTPDESVTPEEPRMLAGSKEQLSDEPPVDDDDEPPHFIVANVTIVRRLNNESEADVVRDWLHSKLADSTQQVQTVRTSSSEATASFD